MKPCSFVIVNRMPLKMVGDLNRTWWKVDLITVQLLRFMECIYLVQKLENELTAHQERDHNFSDRSSLCRRLKAFSLEQQIFISDKVKQLTARNIFQPHHKVALMGDPLILNGLLAQSYLNPFMVFPQLFSMTIYMYLVVFILIREGMVLIS